MTNLPLAHQPTASRRPAVEAVRDGIPERLRLSRFSDALVTQLPFARHGCSLKPCSVAVGGQNCAMMLVICLCVCIVWLWASPSCAGAMPGKVSLLLTQVPLDAQSRMTDREAAGLGRKDWFAGARIVIATSEGQMRPLSEGFHSACDPDISFDANRVVFAGKKNPDSPWRIYEIGLDGQGLRPVTPENQNARHPIYLSTLFTLDSPQPWFTIAYAASETTVNEFGCRSSSALYNVRLDGTDMRRLTYAPNDNFDPFQMWDGRILYASEQYPLEPGRGGGSRVRLFGIHIEGADVELYGGEQGRRIQYMPCATANGLVLFVESDSPAYDGAGQLACVDQSRPHTSYQRLTENQGWLCLYPYPWHDNLVLVSRRPADGKGTAAVFAFDTERRTFELVFDSQDHHDVQARPLVPRKSPDGHSTVVDASAKSGVFYGMNSYIADQMMQAHLASGTIKRVRIVEGLLQSGDAPYKPAPASLPVPRRLIGEAPVEPDGSFNVEVPANTPLLLQTLDERGLALATCGWIWVQSKETRGCIGCHEDPELVPENRYVQALRRPSNHLVLPPDKRRSVVFTKDIAPIVEAHCATADCHAGNRTPLILPLSANERSDHQLRQAYLALMAPEEDAQNGSPPLPQSGRYVDQGRARTSWLVWQIFGTNTSRPWDQPASAPATSAKRISRMPPARMNASLKDDQTRTIVQWIDMGAPFALPEVKSNSKTKPAETE